MKIDDFKNTFDNAFEVSNEAQLKRAMAHRYHDDSNEFWLWHEPNKHPALVIGVKQDLAFLCYHPEEREAGFIFLGSVGSLDPNGVTEFRSSDSRETLDILNEHVVPWAAAYEAAREFLHSDALPSSIEWFEL